MKRMVKEYKSFFRPFQGESYSEDMAFRDPLISTKGRDMCLPRPGFCQHQADAPERLLVHGFVPGLASSKMQEQSARRCGIPIASTREK